MATQDDDKRAAQRENARNQAAWANLHRSGPWMTNPLAGRILPTPGIDERGDDAQAVYRAQQQQQQQHSEGEDSLRFAASTTPLPPLRNQAAYDLLAPLLAQGVAAGILSYVIVHTEYAVTVSILPVTPAPRTDGPAGDLQVYLFEPTIDAYSPGSK